MMDIIIFTIAGRSTSLIELLAAVFGLTCVFLASRAKVLNFWVGYAYTCLLFIMFLDKNLYSSMLLQPVSLLINIFGHYRWTHPKDGEKTANKELLITALSNKQRLFYIGLVVALAAIWGLILIFISNKFPEYFNPARLPFLDAFVTMTILTAMYLSAQKKLDCWYAWLVVNITNSIIYLSAGLVFMPLVSLTYLVMAYFGFKTWNKKYKEKN